MSQMGRKKSVNIWDAILSYRNSPTNLSQCWRFNNCSPVPLLPTSPSFIFTSEWMVGGGLGRVDNLGGFEQTKGQGNWSPSVVVSIKTRPKGLLDPEEVKGDLVKKLIEMIDWLRQLIDWDDWLINQDHWLINCDDWLVKMIDWISQDGWLIKTIFQQF